jgi:hypothetical protein
MMGQLPRMEVYYFRLEMRFPNTTFSESCDQHADFSFVRVHLKYLLNNWVQNPLQSKRPRHRSFGQGNPHSRALRSQWGPRNMSNKHPTRRRRSLALASNFAPVSLLPFATVAVQLRSELKWSCSKA